MNWIVVISLVVSTSYLAWIMFKEIRGMWIKRRDKKQRKELFQREHSRGWLSVEEHQPDPGKLYHCYTDVFGVYVLAKYNPVTGWSGQDGDALKSVTHFWDAEIPLPFPIRDSYSKEKAKEYGMIVDEDPLL